MRANTLKLIIRSWLRLFFHSWMCFMFSPDVRSFFLFIFYAYKNQLYTLKFPSPLIKVTTTHAAVVSIRLGADCFYIRLTRYCIAKCIRIIATLFVYVVKCVHKTLTDIRTDVSSFCVQTNREHHLIRAIKLSGQCYRQQNRRWGMHFRLLDYAFYSSLMALVKICNLARCYLTN